MIPDVLSHQPQVPPLYTTEGLECPFAWKKESCHLLKNIHIFPPGMDLTLSFTATRNSKILGYIPLIGTAIGVSRIYMGIREYLFFKNGPIPSLSNRSLTWIARGALETIPVLGGLVCIIVDFVTTLRYNDDQNTFKNDASPHAPVSASLKPVNVNEIDQTIFTFGNNPHPHPSLVPLIIDRINANEDDEPIFIEDSMGNSYPSALNKIDPTDLATACKIFTLSLENAKNLDIIEKRYTFLINSLKKTQSKLSNYMKQELQIQMDYVHSVYPTLVAHASAFSQVQLNAHPARPYKLEEID